MHLRTLRALRRSMASITGLILTAAFMIMALSAPLICPPNLPDPYRLKKDMFNPLAPPGTPGHPLGTDSQGSDILYGMIWGSRLSISISVRVVAISVVVGVLVGLLSGYVGGVMDVVMMSLTDVVMAIPPYILAMAILAAFGANVTNLTVTLMVVFWPRFARMVRSQVLAVRELGYVDAARTVGMSTWRVVLKHVLPNVLAPVFVQATLGIGSIVLWTAGLSFIGLAPPDLAEWGNMVSLGRKDILGGSWWPSVFPGLMIFLFVLGVNLVGDGLRDVLDPKRRGRR